MLALSARPDSIALAVVGAVVLGGSTAWARHPRISTRERAVFRAVNRLPNWLYPVLWLPMQCGNLVVGVVLGAGIALALGDFAVAVATVVAAAAKLVAERVMRKRIVGVRDVRQRPGTSEPGAILRGDVPVSGPSFPSGHVILVAAIAGVIVTALPGAWQWAPWLVVALVAVARVYVGAHNPLDVTAGLGAGLVIGGLLGVLLRS
jgi:undecaprenyl-diphosphatase